MKITPIVKPVAEKLANWVLAQIDKGKKKHPGVVGWIKTGLLVLTTLVIAVVVVGVVVSFFLFCYTLPGLLFGTSLWLAWTYAGLGAQLFPQLDHQWLTLSWTQFFWITLGVYWLTKLLGLRRKTAKTESPK